MKKAVLLYNPAAGKLRERRRAIVEEVARVFDAAGVAREIIATDGPGSAGIQAAAAAELGATTVFACGGDGTVHEVLQGLTSDKKCALGVIPMGSANVVARHLGLPMNPVEAARVQLGWRETVLPVGRVECQGRRRAFLALAGAGPDGSLVYHALADGKARFGRAAYYLKAAALFCTRKFHPFVLEFRVSEDGPWESMEAVSAMTVRVRDMGGLFSSLACGELDSPHLELSVLRPPARYSFPAWFASGYARAHRMNPMLRRLQVQAFRCIPRSGDRLDIQADGEWLGCAPAEISIVTDGVRLLVPPEYSRLKSYPNLE
jgi:diacylglycerol kinase family enzyme